MNRNKNFKKRPFKGKRHRREEFYLPGNGMGVKIPDSDPGTLEKGLRYLKRQLKDADTMMTLREKRYYTKPSLRKRKQKEEVKSKYFLIDIIKRKKF